MAQRLGDHREMPDVPKPDFDDALAELWFPMSYAAYHLAYLRVYSQSGALRTKTDEVGDMNQAARDNAQADVVICRAHLASFFWQLERVFEALRTAATRGQKEHPTLKYFWTYELRLDEIDGCSIRQEIKDYRNMGHQVPAIIGCKWDEEGHFLHHFLPTISGHQKKEDIDMNTQLQQYFEFAANVWLEFLPKGVRETFPHDFKFPVTVPYMFLGDLPKGLSGVPQLEVTVKSYDRAKGNSGVASDYGSVSGRNPAPR